MFKVVRENVLAVNEDRKSQQRNRSLQKNKTEILEINKTKIWVDVFNSTKEGSEESVKWKITQ